MVVDRHWIGGEEIKQILFDLSLLHSLSISLSFYLSLTLSLFVDLFPHLGTQFSHFHGRLNKKVEKTFYWRKRWMSFFLTNTRWHKMIPRKRKRQKTVILLARNDFCKLSIALEKSHHFSLFQLTANSIASSAFLLNWIQQFCGVRMVLCTK